MEFCNKLSEREGLKPYYELEVKARIGASIEDAEVKILGGTGYHIPTDPEWEHGCRAGKQGKYCFGDNDADLAEYAWYDQNSGKKAHVVGELKPNGFSLYDIHGNVREWNEEVPMSVTPGIPTRVSRGGAWAYTAANCEVSPRQLSHLGHRFFFIGLRLARDPFGEAKVAVNAAKEPPPLDATNVKEVQAAWAAKLKVEVEEKSPSGIVMMLIPPGSLVDHPYRLGKYEVTQGEWKSVMNNNPNGSSTGPRFPVENVSWYDCVEFCNKLSEQEGYKPYYDLKVKTRKAISIEAAEVTILGGTGYHLPTDAEWEHGCRAGSQSTYFFGDNEAELAEYAWYLDNSRTRSHPVGELKPNRFGLHDVHGNVREWNETERKRVLGGPPERVNRGGSWSFTASACAASHQAWIGPHYHINFIGLRLARNPFSEAQAPVAPAAKKPPPLDETNAKEVQVAWAARLKVQVEETPPKMGIVMTLIPPGELVNYPYRLGKYEVTQGEWEAVMGYNPSDFKKGKKEVESLDTSRFPVEHVSWYDSVELCNKLSEREGLKPYYELEVTKRSTSKQIDEAEVKILGGAGFRLPIEAEWEQGCRAGTKTTFSFGDSEAYLGDYAWIDRNSGKRTHVVGEKKPNAFGIYDMHGNVWEWNYEEHEVDSRTKRVLRGGSFNLGGAPAQVSNRNSWPQANRSGHSGFRLARTFVPLGR